MKKDVILDDIIQKIRDSVPEDVGLRLQIKKWRNLLLIKPEGYLGADNFAKLQAKIRELGGEYRSLGKLSHLLIELETPADMDALVEHYETQQVQQQTLIAAPNLTIQCHANSPGELQKMLDILKKNVRGLKNGAS